MMLPTASSRQDFLMFNVRLVRSVNIASRQLMPIHLEFHFLSPMVLHRSNFDPYIRREAQKK